MKRFGIFITISLMSSLLLGQVNFIQGTWAEVLEEAKTQHKLIFVDAYTEWCGPCKMMNRNTFPDEEVATFFNENFVSYKFDMEKGEGVAFSENYQVNAFPTLLFINYKGKVVKRHMGYLGPRGILTFANQAMDPALNQANLELLTDEGDAKPYDLYNYALNLKRSKKDYREAASKYFDTQEEKDLLNEENWKAIQDFTQDIHTREFQYLLEKQKKFAKKYGKEEVTSKIREVCKKNVIAAVMKKDEALYQSSLKIALDFIDDEEETASRLRMTYAEASKNWTDYAYKAQMYFDKYTIRDADELIRAAKQFSRYITDEEMLRKAVSWARQANALDNSDANKMVYADLLFKTGEYRQALQLARQVKLAKEEQGEDTEEMDRLIDQIRSSNNR